VTDSRDLDCAPDGESEGGNGEFVGPAPAPAPAPGAAPTVSAHFEGPLPPANELKRYDEVVPGLGERIVVMAEKEQDHRHSLDRVVIEDQAASNRNIIQNRKDIMLRGQAIAGGLSLIFLLAGLLVIFLKDPIVGGAIAVTGALTIVASFLNHSNGKSAVMPEKAPTPSSPDESD